MPYSVDVRAALERLAGNLRDNAEDYETLVQMAESGDVPPAMVPEVQELVSFCRAKDAELAPFVTAALKENN